jgi:hypothetical protein
MADGCGRDTVPGNIFPKSMSGQRQMRRIFFDIPLWNDFLLAVCQHQKLAGC